MKLVNRIAEELYMGMIIAIMFLTEDVEIFAVRTDDYSAHVSPVWFTSWEMARDLSGGRRIMASKVMRFAIVSSRPSYDKDYEGYSFRLFRHHNKHAVRTAKTA